MKLALKIVGVCLITMILGVLLSGWLIVRREYQLVEEVHQKDAARVANLIRESVDVVYQKKGQQGIVQAIRTHTVETGELTYRWVWFDVSVNDPNRPIAPLGKKLLDEFLAGKMDSVVDTNGDRLHTYYPMDVHEKAGKARKGAIEVSGSLKTAEQEAWRTIWTGLIASAVVAGFCLAFVTWAGIRMVGKPLTQLIDQTRLIGDGVYDQPLRLSSKDEFGELASALNSMGQKISEQQRRIENETAARVATMDQLRHADRLKTVGRLAAGIAHEVGTPLNVVSGRAGLIRSGKLTAEELEESAAAIQAESDRIAGIVRQLMDFARSNTPKQNSIDVRVLVERTIQLLKTIADKSGVTIDFSPNGGSPFTAFVDESQIQQVLTNLIVNAIQAMPGGGKIEIELENIQKALNGEKTRGFVQISIRDHGPGMDDETRSRIFEPFFTTKDIGKGSGLGLSIAHGIVEEHGGQIEVESEPGVGTTFWVWLPKE